MLKSGCHIVLYCLRNSRNQQQIVVVRVYNFKTDPTVTLRLKAIMASFCWITTFACLALFILSSRGDYVVVNTPFTGRLEEWVFFPDTLFRQFYQCLSNRQTSSCTAWYEAKGSRYFALYQVTNISQSLMNPPNQIDLLFYFCIVYNSYFGKIFCLKTSINCDDKNKYQRFKFTTTGIFNDNCVGTTSDRTFHVGIDDRFETCEGYCYDRSNTTTVTTTVIPITVIPTTDIKDHVVTATTTSLTQDTTNLTESLQKESNNENDTGIIVGVTVTLVILIVVIVLAVFLWRKWKRNRKTPERNHESSNFGMSRDNLNMDGYENTHNMRDEEILRTGQVASPDTYSNVDYRNQDTTINSNLNMDGYENTADMNFEEVPRNGSSNNHIYSNTL